MGSHLSAPESAQFMQGSSRLTASIASIAPIRLTIVCALVLSVVVVGGTGVFLSTLRARILANNERELANTAMILSKQIEAVFNSVESVQLEILKQIEDFGLSAGEDRKSVV
jgi:hypothetical protein